MGWNYHRRSPRHPSHDRAGPGVWLLTISTWDSLKLFGTVMRGQVHLNELGTIVHDCWAEVRRGP